MLIPPPGILRPNRRAIEAGLSFAQAFQNGPAAPFLARGGLADATLAFQSGASVSVLQGGHAMTTGYWGANSASNTYALNTTEGTMLAALVADHGPGDSAAHMIAHFGNPAFPAGPSVEMVKFNDGNFYFGIISGSNKRITVSAAGQYAAGDPFTAGTTWDTSGQVAYCKGVAIGSNALTGLGDTSGSDFSIGDLIGASWPWATSAAGGVLYVLVFDRALSAAEMLAAERDMWWWVERPRAPDMRRAASIVSVSLIGVAMTASAGTLTSAVGMDAGGEAATGSAGSVGAALDMTASGSAATASAGTPTSAIAMSASGVSMTVSAGSLTYSLAFTLTGVASTSASGTLAADNGSVDRTLTGISMTALPGNVRVTGGTRWRPSEAQAVVPPSMVGNTLQPPPRLVGDPAADNRAIQQWLQTLYDHVIKRDNVLGRIADHENRIASLEASNDNGST